MSHLNILIFCDQCQLQYFKFHKSYYRDFLEISIEYPFFEDFEENKIMVPISLVSLNKSVGLTSLRTIPPVKSVIIFKLKHPNPLPQMDTQVTFLRLEDFFFWSDTQSLQSKSNQVPWERYFQVKIQEESQELVIEVYKTYFQDGSNINLCISPQQKENIISTYKKGPPFPTNIFENAANGILLKSLKEPFPRIIRNFAYAVLYRYYFILGTEFSRKRLRGESFGGNFAEISLIISGFPSEVIEAFIKECTSSDWNLVFHKWQVATHKYEHFVNQLTCQETSPRI
jgi:hypothetical protein